MVKRNPRQVKEIRSVWRLGNVQRVETAQRERVLDRPIHRQGGCILLGFSHFQDTPGIQSVSLG
jgi:hypothetical protein